MFVVFLALIIGPLVASSQILGTIKNLKIPMQLLQPVGYNNNDTSSTPTGTDIVPGLGAKGTAAASSS